MTVRRKLTVRQTYSVPAHDAVPLDAVVRARAAVLGLRAHRCETEIHDRKTQTSDCKTKVRRAGCCSTTVALARGAVLSLRAHPCETQTHDRETQTPDCETKVGRAGCCSTI